MGGGGGSSTREKKKEKKSGEINFSDIYSTWSQRERTLVTVALECRDKTRMVAGDFLVSLKPARGTRAFSIQHDNTGSCVMFDTKTPA